jgi:hypothetical protein
MEKSRIRRKQGIKARPTKKFAAAKPGDRPSSPRLFPAWVLALGLACAAAAMWTLPLNDIPYNQWGDTTDYFSVIRGAADALREGQFPVREIPHVLLRLPPVFQRYGVFQFYNSLLMNLAGGLALAGAGPWQALMGLVFLAVFSGFAGCFALARRLECGVKAAAAAAALYTLAPNHLLSLAYKGAYSEQCVFGILPWLFLSVFNTATRPGWKAVVLNGLAWALLMHTHHVFHAWTVPFLGLGLVLWRFLKRPPQFSFPRCLAGYGLGLVLSLWFVLPGLLVGRRFTALETVQAPLSGLQVLASLRNLFGFALAGLPSGAEINTPSLYHLGWPILAGILAFALYHRRAGLKEPVLWLFLAAFFLAWGPVNYWGLLGPWKMIQTKSRFMVYAVLFGSLLAGLAWQKLAWASSRTALGVLVLVQLAIHHPYQQTTSLGYSLDGLSKAVDRQGVLLYHQPYPYLIPETLAGRMAGQPDLREASGTPLKSFQIANGLEVLAPSGRPQGSLQTGLKTRAALQGVAPGSLALLPAPWYPFLYRLHINGKEVAYGRVENRLAVALPGGDVELSYRLTGIGWANTLSLVAWILLLGGMGFVGIKKWKLWEVNRA